MLLAIDAGNTNIVFAIYEGDKQRAQWRAMTNAQRTADEYAVWLNQLLELKGLKLADLDGCIISSVVPQSVFNLRNLSRRYLHTEPLVVGDNVDMGIAVHLSNPEEVGADRLVNALGAHITYPGALLIVDSGTATTFDVVGADGAFEGGVIAPGINLSLQALHTAAARLPRVAIQRPEHAIGRGTVEAMQSGIYWGYVALIEGLIDRVKAEFAAPLTVIATGGVASLFVGATAKIDHFDADLTIRGMLEIWRRNSGKGEHS
jgi:type III pantothenate kinase